MPGSLPLHLAIDVARIDQQQGEPPGRSPLLVLTPLDVNALVEQLLGEFGSRSIETRQEAGPNGALEVGLGLARSPVAADKQRHSDAVGGP